MTAPRTADEAIERMADEAVAGSIRPRKKIVETVLYVDGRPATEQELQDIARIQERKQKYFERVMDVHQRAIGILQLMAEIDARHSHIIT